ncbi:ROK family protein [Streptomyces sp. GMY02]|uniref:ROK family protein n=1 Tax=Streptomyces sp. GMY02 TaxID=1333528 RepID=UPI001C2C0F03|nr:ROK family protein [Streptomyces sp. GMY02]QXE33860.1 ROK family protein [Streptomyces sp. GMY02]
MIPVLEIGGTHVTAALVDLRNGRISSRTRRPLDPHGAAEDILGTVRRCAEELPARPGARWGVAVPGPFDYAAGIALFAGVGKFDALYGIDVRAALRDGLWQPPGDVVFLNDAHAFLTGEWFAGAACGHRRAVGITLGTGVGSAFLADGSICEDGAGVPPEGRMDLTEIDGRPLEDTVSRQAILARYGDPAADVHDIAQRARSGEERAHRVLDDAFTKLGAALGPRLTDFNATVLVVGGSISRSWDLVAPALHTGLVTGGWAPDAVSSASPRPPVGPAPSNPRRVSAAVTRHTRAMKPASTDGEVALIGAARAATAWD